MGHTVKMIGSLARVALAVPLFAFGWACLMLDQALSVKRKVSR